MTGPLPPGSVIGILGGGQLGRMSAVAAAQLGYTAHIFDPKPNSPAAQVAAQATVAPYDDRQALAAFARSVDAVTYEFENVPADTAAALGEHGLPLRPRPEVLAVCQDRVREKRTLTGLGIPTAEHAVVEGPEQLAGALDAVGRPAVLKATRMGYDGKGQVTLREDTDPHTAWARMAGSAPGAAGIVEAMVPFALECSVIVARGAAGEAAAYVPVENRHPHHVLERTVAPAAIAPEVAARADALARRVAEGLDLVGVMGVEMFVRHDGGVLVNELAPRPHNSGHWTLDACPASQFEQHARAVMGLPLAATRRHSDAVMDNLLGEDVHRWHDLVRDPEARVHLYGKGEVRPGRKMGHVTWLLADAARAGV